MVNELNLLKGIISLGHCKWCEGGPRGGWSTKLPISSWDYQIKHRRTLAEVAVFEAVDEITFDITDDYGSIYSLIVTGEEMKNPIVQDQVEAVKLYRRQK